MSVPLSFPLVKLYLTCTVSSCFLNPNYTLWTDGQMEETLPLGLQFWPKPGPRIAQPQVEMEVENIKKPKTSSQRWRAWDLCRKCLWSKAALPRLCTLH